MCKRTIIKVLNRSSSGSIQWHVAGIKRSDREFFILLQSTWSKREKIKYMRIGNRPIWCEFLVRAVYRGVAVYEGRKITMLEPTFNALYIYLYNKIGQRRQINFVAKDAKFVAKAFVNEKFRGLIFDAEGVLPPISDEYFRRSVFWRRNNFFWSPKTNKLGKIYTTLLLPELEPKRLGF